MSEGYVAEASSERGDVVLRRREGDGALELRVNGVFVMDTVDSSSERRLAQLTLAAATATGTTDTASEGLTVLVGGLGLGFTLAEVLRDKRVDKVLVVEIEPSLVDWHERGLVPASRVDDPRVEVTIGDIRQVVEKLPAGAVDVLLLDVDNGPGQLVHLGNADVYGVGFLERCRRALRTGGRLAVWSADTSPALRKVLEDVFGECDEEVIEVRLGRRDATYHVFLGNG